MGLKALRPTMGFLAPRVKAAPKTVDRFYVSVDWRALRAAKLAQGPAFCCVCGKKGRLILDHRDERSDGGDDLPALDRLDWYCHSHHNTKTAAERARRAVG
jgi:5-methylcytosine-specific restriction enzyme A